MRSTPQLFQCLTNRVFARLYFAQTINLIGDALTWIGLALLAFELADKNASVILSGALTLRVTAFVLLSPLAGVVADRFDRKRIMVVTHLARMLIVSLLLQGATSTMKSRQGKEFKSQFPLTNADKEGAY